MYNFPKHEVLEACFNFFSKCFLIDSAKRWRDILECNGGFLAGGKCSSGLGFKTFNSHQSHPSQWLLGHLSLELSDNGRGKRVFKRGFIIVETLRERKEEEIL